MSLTILELVLTFSLFIAIIFIIYYSAQLQYTKKLKGLDSNNIVEAEERSYEIGIRSTVAGIKRYEENQTKTKPDPVLKM